MSLPSSPPSLLTTTAALAALLITACAGEISNPGAGDDPPDADPDAGIPGDPDDPGPPPLPGDGLFGAPLGTATVALPGVQHGLAPTPLWGDVPGPYPTNAWWLNLVLEQGENAINVLPYLVKALPDGLSVCAPRFEATDRFIFSVFTANVSLGAAEPLASRTLAGYDSLSATMAWRGTDGGTLTAPLVRGMAYATVTYADMTPRLTSQHAVLSVNGASASSVTGTRFDVALDNGQRWLVYTSAPVTFEWNTDGLTATAPLSGHVRVALASTPEADAVLDEHAGAVPIGGIVDAYPDGDRAALVFAWQTIGDGNPLMMTLPHHRDTLTLSRLPLSYRTIKGEMVAVAAARWQQVEELPTITWTAPRAIDPSRRADLLAALAADKGIRPVAGDPYFFGKQIAAMGRLALIADELGETATAAEIRAGMAEQLAPWLATTGNGKLAYDQTWGGIIAAGAENDPGAAFGQGFYNDHHFHYGYFLYAAAALAVGDPAWAAANEDAVVALARNIANPNAADKQFAVFRNKDWFVGHSWAAGLFDFADSRNQESTSEAVNAWYGLALWGEATGDARMRDLGRLMTATELRSVQRYWQMTAQGDIYPPPFADNKAVGILWSTKVEYATFFGANVEFIHAIQMLPFTPMTELLLPQSWIAEEYPVLATALTRPTPELLETWRGFIVMAHAIIDKSAAWDEAQTLNAYDDGNSRTNTLYWIATRP